MRMPEEEHSEIGQLGEPYEMFKAENQALDVNHNEMLERDGIQPFMYGGKFQGKPSVSGWDTDWEVVRKLRHLLRKCLMEDRPDVRGDELMPMQVSINHFGIVPLCGLKVARKKRVDVPSTGAHGHRI